MKNHTNTTMTARSGLALALALAIWSPVHGLSLKPAKGKTMMAAPMMESARK